MPVHSDTYVISGNLTPDGSVSGSITIGSYGSNPPIDSFISDFASITATVGSQSETFRYFDYDRSTRILSETLNNGASMAISADFRSVDLYLPSTGMHYTTSSATVTSPCYCPGTLIMTEAGEREVETFSIGDSVLTAAGQARPIKWIGRRGYTGRFANANPAVLPVTIRAGALGDGLPKRDLHVSPHHALFLDDVLVPAIELVNGVSITQASRVEQVVYLHLELDSHDILLVEGVPAESFVDDGGRGIFQNAGEYRVLYPDDPDIEALYCAPRVEHGPQLQSIRARIDARASAAA